MAIKSHITGIPLGTGPRPVKPTAGEIRLNTTSNTIETYDGNQWHVLDQAVPANKVVLTTGKEKFGECEYWVEAAPSGMFSDRRQKNIEIEEWVVATYGPKSDWGNGRWTASDSRYWFKKEADRDWFIVKWSS